MSAILENLNGVVTDVPPITPSDTADNMPVNAIGFIAHFTGGSDTRGTFSAIMPNGETRTIPFTTSIPMYIKVVRIRDTDKPANCNFYALVATNKGLV